jgi:hypothetical protein
LTTTELRISTAIPSWGFAQFTDTARPPSTDLPSQIHVLLRRNASGWHVSRWFVGIRGLTCERAADEAGIPFRVMKDLGLCKFISKLV